MRLLTFFLVLLSPALASAADFKAGAFAQDVTPTKFPISVNGGFADRKATAANDPLHARCLVLDDGTTKLAMVVVDSCMMPRELLDAAKALAEKKTGIPAANMLISATHTHTAPTVAGVFQSDPDAEYVKFLTEKIAEGIEQAHKRRVPAKLAWGVAREPKQVFNRRWKMKPGFKNPDPFGGEDKVRMNPPRTSPDLIEPAGPTDPAVTVLSVRKADGTPLALFANYSLHYVGDLPPLSADYFGAFANSVAAKLKADKDFVAALSNGTSGDVNNIDFRAEATKTAPGERCRLVADAVATAALKAIDSAEYFSPLALKSLTADLELGVRKPTADEIKRAEGILEKARGRELRGAEEVYARETVLMAKYPDKVSIPLQLMLIDGEYLFAIPCEVFAEIGLELKKIPLTSATTVVSLANGYYGYLPTPAQHALGGYETWRARSSFLEVGASVKIEKALTELLIRSGRK
jgi:hypothetical protein